MPSLPDPTVEELSEFLSSTQKRLLRWFYSSRRPEQDAELELVRFGPGEFTAPAQSAWIARRLMVTALRQMDPEAFQTVAEIARLDVLRNLQLGDRNAGIWSSWNGQCPQPLDCPDPLLLLETWGENHNLPAEGCASFLVLLFFEGLIDVVDLAYTAVKGEPLPEEFWSEQRFNWFDGFGSLGVRFEPTLQPFAFAMPAWNPELFDWQSFKAEAQVNFRQALESHRASQLAAYGDGEKNTVPTPAKRRAFHHCCWYIQYQVRNESLDDIAVEEFLHKTAIRDAIHEIAKLAQLPVRPPKRPGRKSNASGQIV